MRFPLPTKRGSDLPEHRTGSQKETPSIPNRKFQAFAESSASIVLPFGPFGVFLIVLTIESNIYTNKKWAPAPWLFPSLGKCNSLCSAPPNKLVSPSLTLPRFLSHTPLRFIAITSHRYRTSTIPRRYYYHTMGGKRTKNQKEKPKQIPTPAKQRRDALRAGKNAGNHNTSAGEEIKDQSHSHASEGNGEVQSNEDLGDVQLRGESSKANGSKADKGEVEQKSGGEYHVAGGSVQEQVILTRTEAKGKGKQRAGNGDDKPGPKDKRADSVVSLKHIKAESTEWIKKHSGQNAQSTTQPAAYRVPPLNRISSHHSFASCWPHYADGSIVTISGLKCIYDNLCVWAHTFFGSEENWSVPWPNICLTLLRSICDQAEESAKVETRMMELELNHYRKIFPSQQAAILQWPMLKNKHWTRAELLDVMVG
jgi:hypothetical protein